MSAVAEKKNDTPGDMNIRTHIQQTCSSDTGTHTLYTPAGLQPPVHSRRDTVLM